MYPPGFATFVEVSGLSDVLAGDCGYEEAIQQVRHPRARNGSGPDGWLDVIVAGAAPPNPAELIDSARMRDLIQELTGVYDFVVVDCGPALAVPDPLVLMSQVDGVLVVSQKVKNETVLRQLDIKSSTEFVITIGAEKKELAGKDGLALLEGNELPPGGRQLAQLFLAEPVVAVYGQPFVLREESPPATLGGGRVLQPRAHRLRRRDHLAISRLDRLRSNDPIERLAAVLSFLGLRPWTERGLCALSGLAVEQVSPALDELTVSLRLVSELPAKAQK